VAGGRVFDPTACMRAVVHSRSILHAEMQQEEEEEEGRAAPAAQREGQLGVR
jgi:hypothetical protein